MILRAEDFLKSSKIELSNWERDLAKVNEGVYEYDGTIPNECFDELCKHKIGVFTEVVDYLESLDKDTIISDGRGITKEGVMYYALVNR